MTHKQKVYYIATENGKPILRDHTVPIFWQKKIAMKEFKNWPKAKIVRCTIDIWTR